MLLREGMTGSHVDHEFVNPISELNPWGLQKGRGDTGASLRNERLGFEGKNALHYSFTRECGMPCRRT